MMVQTPLELYTVVLGFKYYDLMWEMFRVFGLVYLPFVGLMITGLTKPFEVPIGYGADLAMRRTVIDFFLIK